MTGKRILIVEDDELVGELIELRLKTSGYDTELIRNGAEAVPRALATPPDIVLCDLWLPGMTGLEVIRALRAAGAAYPIIAMTASRYGPESAQALEAGAVETMQKPFPFSLLLDVLKTRLG